MSGCYIAIDLMMIITSGSVMLDDYILGAMTLYIDLIRMFLYILSLLAKSKKK